ncbi:MAG: HAD family hydrolase [Erysipelotrichaceae bacterium]|nr:HAD family hydrolase [Erysipelotrichaceae bacterium]
MKEYSSYVFDLYGTLVDIHTDESKASFWKKMSSFFQVYRIDYPYRELRRDYLLFCEEEEEKREGEDVEIDLHPVFERLFRSKGIAPEEEDIRRFALSFREASRSHLRLYAGAADLLRSLKQKGKGVYLLSNAQALFTVPELEELGITDLFDGIVLSSDVGFKKPSIRIFEAFFTRFDLKREECLYIGNDPYSDGEGALQAGLDVYLIRSALSPSGKEKYDQEGMDLRKLKRKLMVR